ncbi:MAG: hypothetical protein PHG65_10830, partial [Kiritimatiellae bacterium]|nr:hypothetical protein [Kiritimatiellia bacterium]
MKKVLLLLLFCVFLTGLSALGVEDITEFRNRYDNDVRELQDAANKKAQKLRRSDGTVDTSSPEYQEIQQEYNTQKQQLRQEYNKNHPAKQTWEDLQEFRKDGKLRSTGSDHVAGPGSDMDLTASDNATADAAVKKLKAKGHKVTYDPELGMHIDHSSDTKIWEPGTPEQQRARANNPEGYTRSGSLEHEKISSPDAQYDPEGYVEDLNKKYEAAKKSGDTRTQNKAARKMQEATGKTPDSVTEKMGVDADPFESGESNFGESEAVTKAKAAKRAEAMDKGVQEARETAKKQSESNARMREDLAKQERELGNKKSAKEYTDANKKIENTKPKAGEPSEITSTTDPDGPGVKQTPKKSTPTDVDGPGTTDVDGPGAKQSPKKSTPTDVDGPGAKSSGKAAKTTPTDVDGPGAGVAAEGAETMAGKVGKTVGEAMDGAVVIHQAGKVRDGIKEGDDKKILEGLGGKDIADRSDVAGGGDYVDARGAEGDAVSEEAEGAAVGKLKRMGATDDELDDYRENYGTSKGREVVEKVKARGGKDEKGHQPLEGMSEEESSWTAGEQAKEGAKQAGSYGKTVLDGVSLGGVTRGEEAQGDLDGAVSDSDHVLKQTEESTKSRLYTELRDRGASETEAKEALKDYYKDKQGVRDLVEKLKERDPEKAKGSDRKKEGLSVDNVDIEEDGEGAGGRIKTTFTEAGKGLKELVIDTPVEYVNQTGKDIADASHDALEVVGIGSEKNEKERYAAEKNAEADEQLGAKEEKLINMGATPDEAKAAVSGGHKEVTDLTKELHQRNAEAAKEEKIQTEGKEARERLAEKIRESKEEGASPQGDVETSPDDGQDEGDEAANDLFGGDDEESEEDDWESDEDFWNGDEKQDENTDPNGLRAQEGRSESDGYNTDWSEGTGNDVLDQMIDGVEKERYEGSKKAIGFNERQHDMKVASTSGDSAEDRANQQRDSAVQQAEADQADARNKIVDGDRADSWGSAVGEGLAEG